MLTQPLFDKLQQLGLSGFRTALEEQLQSPQYGELSFEERLGLLLDVEVTRRTNNRLKRRIQAAQFPLPASMEDLDLSPRRGLRRTDVLQLAHSEWVGRHLNLLVLGPTGAGVNSRVIMYQRSSARVCQQWSARVYQASARTPAQSCILPGNHRDREELCQAGERTQWTFEK